MEYTGGLWTLSLGLPPPYATLMVRKASPSPPSRAKTWQVGQDPASVPEDGGDANARSTGAAHQAAVAPSYTTVELDEAVAAVCLNIDSISFSATCTYITATTFTDLSSMLTLHLLSLQIYPNWT